MRFKARRSAVGIEESRIRISNDTTWWHACEYVKCRSASIHMRPPRCDYCSGVLIGRLDVTA